ncbi:MAG: hypothetical protein IPI17_17590 [Nitrosomonas sp.]|nr:hypothetical protein [Nitrosomonas sp.]
MISIIETHLDEFLGYSQALLLGDASQAIGKHGTHRGKKILVYKKSNARTDTKSLP